MSNALLEARYLKVMVLDEYETKTGEKKTNWIEVGRAFISHSKSSGEAYVQVKIPQGISLTGEFQIRAPLPKREDSEPGGHPQAPRDDKLPRAKR
jgi:hypothetical protein